MYYRRKILLSLLQVFENQLEKASLQKLLFLLTRQQNKKVYDFVPYKYGCYSFQANADLNTMIKYDLVKTENNIWHKKDDYDYFSELKKNDQVALRFIHQEYINYSSYDLIKYTYTKYPYYAINSTIAERILNQEELVKVNNQRRRKEDIILYTIGYEGISLESYLNKLIIYDVRVLCDVRKNSSSMKYGFNKSQLKNACNGVGIKYVHIPEVGIESDKRQELSCQADYDMLFDDYKRTVLIEQKIKQLEILTLLKKEKRIALTCFEANICQCHRKHLAESISKLDQFNYDLIHLK